MTKFKYIGQERYIVSEKGELKVLQYGDTFDTNDNAFKTNRKFVEEVQKIKKKQTEVEE